MSGPAPCEHSKADRATLARQGFTLIEVAVVIALVAMLTAAAALYYRAPVQAIGLSEAREQLSVMVILQHRRLLDTGAFLPVPAVPAEVHAAPVALDSPALRTLGFPTGATATQLEVTTGIDARGPWFRAVARVQQDQLMELTLDSRDPRQVAVRAVDVAP